ncbi:MAG: Gfo/Idh/MocA family oxidoreductase [Anaerolineae bacterium]|nr:Gfo/Idh/MocA family oxidoreductase [Anaerolineae bacterium]
MSRTINIGLVGYGFMGRAHSTAYRQVWPFFRPGLKPVMKAICGRNEAAVRQAADSLGWETHETSWEQLVNREDIDLIDICTPGDSHRDIAVAAAEAGKHLFCEKPLANSLGEAQEMLAAAEAAGVKHMVNFNYRRVPAVQLAKQLINKGAIGEIRHWRAVYLQDWIVDPEFPLVWRLRREKAGSGALGDIGSHIVDLARFLVGEITDVVGMTATFIKERPLPTEMVGPTAGAATQRGKVTVDDGVAFLARFDNGVIGTFEATRLATGRKNYERFEINGSRGSLVFNFERMNELQFYSLDDEPHCRGFRTILVTERVHPYVNAWWPPGHGLGYEHTFTHAVADLLNAIAEDRMPQPDFAEGVRVQAVLEAVEGSWAQKRWVRVKE